MNRISHRLAEYATQGTMSAVRSVDSMSAILHNTACSGKWIVVLLNQFIVVHKLAHCYIAKSNTIGEVKHNFVLW